MRLLCAVGGGPGGDGLRSQRPAGLGPVLAPRTARVGLSVLGQGFPTDDTSPACEWWLSNGVDLNRYIFFFNWL